jgi:hypothetical protein
MPPGSPPSGSGGAHIDDPVPPPSPAIKFPWRRNDAVRVGTLAELCREPGVPSQPSLQRFIGARPDFPILRRGGSGSAYTFDLDAAASFVREHWRDGRNERKRRRIDAERHPNLFDRIGR